MLKEELDKIKNILIENAKEYYKNGFNSHKNKEYNSAVTLFFKSLSALCDIYIITKEGKMPTSHTDRFRILELNYKNIYSIIDKDFPLYQDSYRSKLNEEASRMLKEDAEGLFKILNIKL